MEKRKKNIGLIGCGSLGKLVAGKISDGTVGGYIVAALFDPLCPEKASGLADESGGRPCRGLEDMFREGLDYVVEAATADAVRQTIFPCLEKGIDYIALSAGAFSDDEFRREVIARAEGCGRTVYLPSGAMGGFDLIQAAGLAGALKVSLTTEKPPRALRGAPGLMGAELSETVGREVFSGTAGEAIAGFPKNANIAVALGLASCGLANVDVRIWSDPQSAGNRHTVTLEGEFGRASLKIEARPSPENPRSSSLAGYSVLSLLRKLDSSFRIA